MQHMRALSIRQPYAEQILREQKTIEYRGRPTNIRERVYIYASLTPGDREDWEAMHLQPGDLPIGVLVGTVEICDCTGRPGDYQWHLTKPDRLTRPLKPKKHPQPVWFYPF
jgi:ASCH domain